VVRTGCSRTGESVGSPLAGAGWARASALTYSSSRV
jgi:hypothetical protein